VTASYCGVNEL